jgi:hypothetical protein
MNDTHHPSADYINGVRIPTVLCERIPSGDGYQFYCRYCDVWHQHGAEEGHARPHCFTDNSPYHLTGYMLVEVPAPPRPLKRYRPRYMRDGRILSTVPELREERRKPSEM